jgi:hypothetical protein
MAQMLDWAKSKNRRQAWIGVLLLVVAAIAAVLLGISHSSHSAAAEAPYPHELAQVSFAVAGDVIPHEPVRAAAASAGTAQRVGARSSPMSAMSSSTPTSAL